ncbi:FecR family protein [Pedobacter nutrimenti]|uniref:FecR family protein n=1 Tax=Pedobacter nutrimenti TaxID=1241337 RepID=A0A318U6M8_9SPHI|nr:FecR domain-containing protein [Pedobacter nutrimenti]PYF69364.1 FecR family protein [Pedobacter nutrimenti]
MTNPNLLHLLECISNGTATDAELARYHAWCNAFQQNDVKPLGIEKIQQQMFRQINKQIDRHKTIRLRNFRIVAAAAIALIMGMAYYYTQPQNKNRSIQTAKQNDVKPGGNKAYLTLSNGKRITLSDAANGQLATEAGAQITKTTQGEIIYTGLQATKTGAPQYNSIETPTGGTYQLRLPDGTKVWLNAASVLRYPVSFAASANRTVELSGEAYFEVAKDKQHPFKVTSAGQQVEVLGTHFNISAYPDDNSQKTTLLEGAVKVNSSVLKPGQQAQLLQNGAVHISEVNTEAAVAWKNGIFMFEGEKLESIMKKVARWYNVQVQYSSPALGQEMFSGTLSRFDNISVLLKQLENTGPVKFGLQGKTITISK